MIYYWGSREKTVLLRCLREEKMRKYSMKKVLKLSLLCLCLVTVFCVTATVSSAEQTPSATKVEGAFTSATFASSVSEPEVSNVMIPISQAETYEHMIYGIYGFNSETGKYLCLGFESGTPGMTEEYSVKEINYDIFCGMEYYVVGGSYTSVKAPSGYTVSKVVRSVDELTSFRGNKDLSKDEYMALIQTVFDSSNEEQEIWNCKVMITYANEDGSYMVYDPQGNEILPCTTGEIDGMFDDGEGDYWAVILEKTEEPAAVTPETQTKNFPVWAIVLISLAGVIGLYAAAYFFLFKKGLLTASVFTKIFLPMDKIFVKKA